jgi:hypothetical protein
MSTTPAQPDILTMMLTLKDHSISQELYTQHETPRKRKQVYLNTLAARAVERYLAYFEITVDSTSSPYCDVVIQSLMDTGGLRIPELGILECRPVFATDNHVVLPNDGLDDCLGYVIVQLDDTLKTARLLGFMPASRTGTISLQTLSPLEDVFDVLAPETQVVSHLSHWLATAIDTGWQTIDDLFQPATPRLAFRSAVEVAPKSSALSEAVVRGKRIQLVASEVTKDLLLLVGFQVETADEFDIWVKLFPANGENHLPSDLELKLLDHEGTTLMHAQSRATESLGLKFKGSLGDRFSVHITGLETTLVEQFMV